MGVERDRVGVVPPADHVGGGDARHLLHRPVPDDHALFPVDGHRRVGQEVDDIRQPPPRIGRLGLGPLLLQVDAELACGDPEDLDVRVGERFGGVVALDDEGPEHAVVVLQRDAEPDLRTRSDEIDDALVGESADFRLRETHRSSVPDDHSGQRPLGRPARQKLLLVEAQVGKRPERLRRLVVLRDHEVPHVHEFAEFPTDDPDDLAGRLRARDAVGDRAMRLAHKLCPLPGGDVLKDAEDEHPVVPEDHRSGGFDGDLRRVPADEPMLAQRNRRAVGEIPTDAPDALVPVVGVNEVEVAPSDDPGRTDVDHSRKGVVRIDDRAPGVMENDAERRFLDDRGVLRLALPQFILGALFVGDLHIRAAVAEQSPVVVQERHGAHREPQDGSVFRIHRLLEDSEGFFPGEPREHGRAKRLPPVLGMKVVKTDPADKIPGAVPENRLHRPAHEGVHSVRIDLPEVRPVQLRDPVQDFVGLPVDSDAALRRLRRFVQVPVSLLRHEIHPLRATPSFAAGSDRTRPRRTLSFPLNGTTVHGRAARFPC